MFPEMNKRGDEDDTAVAQVGKIISAWTKWMRLSPRPELGVEEGQKREAVVTE